MSLRRTRWLAVLFFLASAGLTLYLLRRPSVVFLSGSAAIGSVAYLIASRRIPVEEGGEEAPFLGDAGRRRISTLAASAFFVFSALSLVVVLQHPLAKVLLYYGLVAAASASIAVRIVLAPPGRAVGTNLLLIVLLALNIFGTDQLVFPNGIAGGDMGTHIFALVQPILQTGHIPALDACGFFYVTFPGQHVLVASTSLLTGWTAMGAYTSLGFLVMVIPVVVAFLIGRRLFGDRGGLFAGLVLTGSSYYIYWASHDSTLTFALPYLAILILLMFVTMDRPSVKFYGLMAIALTALILTHPYSTVVFGFLALAIVLGQLFVRRDRPAVMWSPRILGAMFSYSLLFYWPNYTCLMSKSFELARGYYRVLLNESIVASPAVYDALPLPTIFLNTIGDSLLQIAFVFGLFLLISRRIDGRNMIIVASTLALFALAGTGLFTRLIYLLPNRVYVFLEMLGLAPLAAVALRDLPRWRFRTSTRMKRSLVIVIVVLFAFSFTFASASSTIAGFETSPYVGPQPFNKLYGTNYESASAGWICLNVPRGSTVNASRSMFDLDRLNANACVRTNTTELGYISYRDISPTGFESVLDPAGQKRGSYLWFSGYDSNPGYQGSVIAFGQTGNAIYDKVVPSSIVGYSAFDKLYDAGPVQVYWVQG
jgi:hypothetical protein